MRKILLGTTAVVGAALLAPTMAAAQEAPTVRVGGYFRAYYGYTQQTGQNVTGLTPQGTVVQPAQVGDAGIGATGTSTAQSARNSQHDFSTDAEIHVFVNGKTANGLTYGAVVEIQFDNNEATARTARRSYPSKTGADIDEAYAFIASPTFGQIRFGDEDGPVGGLMNAGYVTNFGTGGIYGDWQDFVIRPNRTTTSPGEMGDNTKIIYLSPQFFGFDFGGSFALNEGEGADTGCVSSLAGPFCDRAYASQGVTSFGRATTNLPGRRNEYQLMARWRGNLAGVGLAASFGYMGASAVRDITVTGTQFQTLRNPQIWEAGLQATAYGFTLGANYKWGNTSYFYIPTIRGEQDMSQIFLGGSYTAGPFSIGANGFFQTVAGTAGSAFNTTTGVLSQNTNSTPRGQRRYGYGIGANYRLAPGLDLVAEYVRHVIHENGVDLDGQANNGVQDKLRANVFLVGTRLAF
ncbi:porin [Siccirubricoccus sp. G192]|uniref:porin n=1 Tax=Siccirubricoccus sp. G192 TaxID=2849651 RepID=UPI001C2B9E27|nr:porin [Siccirubricoccus sp. G192]MBV1796012.1 porin [Siccirubricoccus sp. G192]